MASNMNGEHPPSKAVTGCCCEGDMHGSVKDWRVQKAFFEELSIQGDAGTRQQEYLYSFQHIYVLNQTHM